MVESDVYDVTLTNPLPFQTKFPKVNRHVGKILIHSTEHRKDN